MNQQMDEAVRRLANVEALTEMMTTRALNVAHFAPKVVEAAIAMMLAADLSSMKVGEAEEEAT